MKNIKTFDEVNENEGYLGSPVPGVKLYAGGTGRTADRHKSGKSIKFKKKPKAVLPPLKDLVKLFQDVNKDCAETGESVVKFTDEEYYASQIQNIFDVTDDEADTLAHDLAHSGFDGTEKLGRIAKLESVTNENVYTITVGIKDLEDMINGREVYDNDFDDEVNLKAGNSLTVDALEKLVNKLKKK